MTESTASEPLPQAIPGGRSHLSAKVIGACLRSAFIEALYDDCSDFLRTERPAATPSALPMAAE